MKFKLWKELMLKKYGKDAKLFRCIQDKILFYSSYDENINDSIYLHRCPICKKSICHFCSIIVTFDDDMCCYKRSTISLVVILSTIFFEYISSLSFYSCAKT